MNENIIFEELRTSNQFHYDVCIYSNIGNREEQQDHAYLAVSNEEVFGVICDGMGGMDSGKIASQTAIQAFLDYVNYYGKEDSEWLSKSAEAVDDIIYNLSDSNGKKMQAGTTLVSIAIIDNCLQWVSVGDSRLYLSRNQQLTQITVDHNLFYDLKNKLDKGEITQEEYRIESRNGEHLLSFLGVGGLPLIDVNSQPLPLLLNDLLILCSDGVYRYINESYFNSIINSNLPVDQIGNALIEAIETLNHKYQDNYTFIIIRKVR